MAWLSGKELGEVADVVIRERRLAFVVGDAGAETKRRDARSVESAAGRGTEGWPRSGVVEQYSPKSHGGNFDLGTGVEMSAA